MKRERKQILKAVLYIVSILLCAAVFIVFGKSADTGGSADDGAEPTEKSKVSPVPLPTSALPYRLEVMLELSKWNLDCGFSEPVTNGNTTEYELIFAQHTDTGRILLETGSDGRVCACTLERRYLYAGEPVITGSEGEALRNEYERRRASDERLINAFAGTMLLMLDYTDEISDKKAESITGEIMDAYADREQYERVEPPLRFFAETEKERTYSTFRLTISFDELTLRTSCSAGGRYLGFFAESMGRRTLNSFRPSSVTPAVMLPL